MTTAREICEVDGATSLRRSRVGAVSSDLSRILQTRLNLIGRRGRIWSAVGSR